MIPRVHGNGFIQLSLTDKIRLHVWPDESYPLKRQKVYTGIHTHRFDYESTLISGKLIHRVYSFYLSDDYTHVLYEPTEDERLASTGRKGVLEISSETVLEPGKKYGFEPGLFHEIILDAPLSCTLMEKKTTYKIPVYIAVRAGEEPDNDFDRDIDNPEEMLWAIIRIALKRAGRSL